jgi:antitoxin (DNA-binding transcriptional repressor) of toxin-antitoxin stability system
MTRRRRAHGVADPLRSGRVTTIPQRELRTDSGAILRRAEAGETFTIAVDGLPVATLGPHRRRQWVPREEVERIFATPTDPTVLDDIRAGGRSDELHDPWTS